MVGDPRTHITPDAFGVAPELLGYALATPTRRLGAILIDLALVALVARTGLVFLLGAAVALLAWRAISGPTERLLPGRGRLLFRAAIAVLALVIAVNVWNGVSSWFQRLDQSGSQASSAAEGGVAENLLGDLGLSASDQASFLVRFAALQMADDGGGERGAELGRWLQERAPVGQRRDEVSASLAGTMKPEAAAAFLRALGVVGGDTAGPAEVAAGKAPSMPQSDSVTDGLPAVTSEAPLGSADSVRLLALENSQLRRRNEELQQRVDSSLEQGGGFRAWLGRISDDLGLGFGWFALYFTAFTVLGRGQTPGKRLLGIKIMRLDNHPLGWWLAFERFGGYAASFSTGLLGFAQMIFDPNRQGLHDKAVGTVVIRLRRGQPVRIT